MRDQAHGLREQAGVSAGDLAEPTIVNGVTEGEQAAELAQWLSAVQAERNVSVDVVEKEVLLHSKLRASKARSPRWNAARLIWDRLIGKENA